MSLLIEKLTICITFVAFISSIECAFSGDVLVHDPSWIKSGNAYYIFSTGYSDHFSGNNPIRKLSNDKSTLDTSVFKTIPTWLHNITKVAPGMWAPDINYINGEYYVYYAASSFGSRNSVIALATSKNVEGPYEDKGEVIHTTDSNQYNAIDPEIAWSGSQLWLFFGSYWEGIKAHRLDEKTGKVSTADTKLYSVASRGGSAIEAASVAVRNGYYYLFVSFDICCKGADSTYRIMVGRSKSITGPYVDKAGVDMMKGGGTQILATHGNVHGPGGQDVINDNGTHRMIYHWYDSNDNGVAKFDIVDLVWADDWPTAGAQSKLKYS